MEGDITPKLNRFVTLKQALAKAGTRPAAPVTTFGLDAIDSHLPEGGLAPKLHELCPGSADLPDEAASTQLAAYLLGRTRGPVIWALSQRFLFAPGIALSGLSPSRLIYVEAGNDADILAVAEEALRHGGLGGVVVEVSRLSLKASRRLQLAAESTGTLCLGLRLWRRGKAPMDGTAAVTRWSVHARPSLTPNKLPRPAWQLDLTRCRGGTPKSWNIELEGGEDADAPLRLCLATELAGTAPGTAAAQHAA